MAPYQYQPLPAGDTIRILQIEPSSAISDQLRGSLQLHSLSQAPDFEALSYVWAQPVTNPPGSQCLQTFQIDGDEVEIGGNLAAAFRRLRLPGNSRLVWADAICINQKDIPEKNSQVQMMGDVYRKAKRTVAWLGEGDAEVEAAICKLSVIADSAPKFGYPPFEATNFISMSGISSNNDLENFIGNPREVIEMAMGANIGRICSVPWFTRFWVAQEAILSSDLVVYLGNKEVDWKILETAISLVHRAIFKAQEPIPGLEDMNRVVDLFTERKNQFLYRPPGTLKTSLDSLFGYSAATIQQSAMFNFIPRQGQFPLIITKDRPRKFLDTLWNLQHRHCKDDRDRIYAALSFIPWDLPIKVIVDYDRTTVEVYTAFTRALLTAHTMNALLFAGVWDRKKLPPINRPDPSLPSADEAPSWVCEFRPLKLKRGRYRPWHNPLYDEEDEMEIDEMESPVIGFEDLPYERRLRIGLTVLDKVEEVVTSLDEEGLDYAMTCRGLYSRYEIFSKARKLPTDEFPCFEELVRFAEVLGLDHKSIPSVLVTLARLLVHGRQIAATLALFSGADARSVEPEWHIPDNLTPYNEIDRSLNEVEKELSLMNRRLTFTALFSTSRGWIGTGPDAIIRGDILVRIRGLLKTCILRKVEGTADYILVGGCFLRDDLGVGVRGEYLMASLI
ncbi:heterokaryon incompatibility protein-domain-containing protein [Nemania sp. FL0031]|nr:heterokaryon incompatibility protein-domain-containing protein [Nemania sp. FL0031]